VELTAAEAPAQLMGLLATSTAYPLEGALAAAAAAGLVKEQVFVLGRIDRYVIFICFGHTLRSFSICSAIP
jgi:hypothetical protein